MDRAARNDDPHVTTEPLYLADWLGRRLQKPASLGRRTRQARAIPVDNEGFAFFFGFGMLFYLGVPDYLLARVEFVSLDPSRVTLELWFLLFAIAAGMRVRWARRLFVQLHVRSDERRRTWLRLIERQVARSVCSQRYIRQRTNLIGAVFVLAIIIPGVILCSDAIYADIVYLLSGVAGPAFEKSPGVVGWREMLIALLTVREIDWIVFVTHLCFRKPSV